ncbi:MAG: SUF system NifU family Fe-S cluster assembly protein, partial [Chloroflexi bacterium]|nr:SUF system NifU family Fe-S cluster assembly protein [Chloroflexota bacterium]
MDALYRDEILEHYRHPHNFGTLPAPDAVHEGSNPLCGDRITLMLGIGEDGTVAEVAFTGRGCAISQASASMLTDEVKGKSLDQVVRIGASDVIEELGIEISPARLKCALLSLDTLRRALADRVAWQAATEV